jgi:regulator of extracellular matrix RemA (YlzA/DUF370 family)
MITLGQKAKDKVTGFEGIIVAKVQYLYGCDQYGLTPPAKDGKVGDTQYFDEGRVEVTGRGILPKEVQTEKPGGVNRDCPRWRKMIQPLHIGFGNYIMANRAVAVVGANSSPIKRIIQNSADGGNLINATYGRKTRAVIVMDTGQIVTAAVKPEALITRLMEVNNDVYDNQSGPVPVSETANWPLYQIYVAHGRRIASKLYLLFNRLLGEEW